MTTKTTACYMRVSTDQQTHDSQKQVLRNWIKAQRLKPNAVRWYADKITGTTTDRPQLQKMLRAVESGKVQTVVLTRLDRLSRRTRQGLETLQFLAANQCRIVATEQALDLNGPMGSFLATLFLALSEFERELTVARIREGMEAARSNGKHIGRPRDDKKLARIRALREKGHSASDVAKRLGCSRQNVYAALKKTEGN